MFTALQLAAVLVVSDPAVLSALQSELPAICLLAKLDPTKVNPEAITVTRPSSSRLTFPVCHLAFLVSQHL